MLKKYKRKAIKDRDKRNIEKQLRRVQTKQNSELDDQLMSEPFIQVRESPNNLSNKEDLNDSSFAGSK